MVSGSRRLRQRYLLDVKNTAGYLPSLDGLRAIGILIVMFAHLVTPFVPGGLGVYLFFIVSGFLISRLLFVEHRQFGSINLPRFYLRRLVRLYPAIIVYTASIVLVYLALGLEVNWWEPTSALLHFANYYYSMLPSEQVNAGVMPFRTFWSLSVEEHFYALFPPLFLLLKGHPTRVLIAMISVVFGALFLRTGIALNNRSLLETDVFYFQTQFRVDSIAFGVGVAALAGTTRGRLILKMTAGLVSFFIGLGMILACLLYRDPLFRETLRYTFIGCGLVIVVSSVLFSENLYVVQRLLNTRILKYIGRMSYSLYVWHLVAPSLADWAFPQMTEGGSMIVNFTLAFGISAMSYHLFELPLVGLRERFRNHSNYSANENHTKSTRKIGGSLDGAAE